VSIDYNVHSYDDHFDLSCDFSALVVSHSWQLSQISK